MPQTRSQGAAEHSGDTPFKRPVPKQKRTPEEDPAPMQCEPIQPSLKEIAAAEAARARLCGGRGAQAVQSDELPTGALPTGPEPVSVEVEYPATADLQPLSRPEESAQAIEALLAAKNWVDASGALNVLRQLVVHHADTIRPSLAGIVPLVVASVKSLRSVQAKTAIMAVTDMLSVLGDEMLPHLDVGGMERPGSSLLAQLLLKGNDLFGPSKCVRCYAQVASNDKRFVVEEAVGGSQAMAANLDSAALLELLMPYIKHKNPKVRGKAAVVLVAAAEQMDEAALAAFGLERLAATAGALVTDNTPDARAAAKQLLPLIQKCFTATAGSGAEGQTLAAAAAQLQDPAESPRQPTPWESFLRGQMSASAAAALLKICA